MLGRHGAKAMGTTALFVFHPRTWREGCWFSAAFSFSFIFGTAAHETGPPEAIGPFLLRPVFLEPLSYKAQVCVHVALNPVKLTLKTNH